MCSRDADENVPSGLIRSEYTTAEEVGGMHQPDHIFVVYSLNKKHPNIESRLESFMQSLFCF